MAYSDDEILEAIGGDDMKRRNQALKQLYFDPVVNGKTRGFIEAYGAHKRDPDEVVQEALILVDDLIRQGKFQGKSKVRTFLIGVCRNLVRSDERKIDRITYATEPLELPDRQLESPNPEEQAILEEKGETEQLRDRLLQRVLGRLTDKCKSVLHLYYFLAQSLAEVAKEQGLKNAHQAKKAARRCREQLKKELRKDPQLANFLKQSL
ncbi:MAG: sigma-70 family RNA polymerase sigma factor [Lewinellaceae bacterium]|nr:sigma-70 family RNA polymerase sigma factor [Lewinellaceae bacterium]